MDKQIRINFICLGNICRSPLAIYIFKEHLRREVEDLEALLKIRDDDLVVQKIGIMKRIEADSFATGSHTEDESADSRTIGVVEEHMASDKTRHQHIYAEILKHRAKPVKADDLERSSYILIMDKSNYENVCKIYYKTKESNGDIEKKIFYLGNFSRLKEVDITYKLSSSEITHFVSKIIESDNNIIIEDPWFGNESHFRVAYKQIEDAVKGVLNFIVLMHLQ